MNLIDQNTALESIDRALVPSLTLIDGRTETDYLDFLVNFSTLINFYDSSNNISSNWQPFLLKDPVFLTASISKTRYTQMHTLFINTCRKIDNRIAAKSKNAKALSNSFNQLFDQLTNIFTLLETWTHYMQKSTNSYNLKTFLISEITYNYAQYFWAILALRQSLSVTDTIPDIQSPYIAQYENYDQKIWQQSKDKRPFWEVLGLRDIRKLKNLKIHEIFNSLKTTGNNLFDFLKIIIKAANEEFNTLKVQRSNYPDTILLRAFVKLLSIQQAELNSISKKHLNFYFKEILLQKKLPASPDSVFASIDLADSTTPFTLPAGTLFDAGINLNDETITFKSVKDVDLNPANILTAYTLSKQHLEDGGYAVYKNEIKDPGLLKKDEAGKTQKWDTFGNGSVAGAQISPFGFVFASPMLYLQEGTRTLELVFEFENSIQSKLFHGAKYFLSTQDKWLNVIPEPFDSIGVEPVESLVLKFILDPSIPAIESFLDNPEEFDTVWPMFKTLFTWFPDDLDPPLTKSLTVNVHVDQLQNFVLSNDDGSLTTTAPFQVLGSTPMPGSNFVMGSAEIFSKPISCLDFNFLWDNLPFVPIPGDDPNPNFETYYKEYNDYINGNLNKEPKSDHNKTKPPPQNIFNSVTNFFTLKTTSDPRLSTPDSSLSESSNDPISNGGDETIFNNTSFEVQFSILQDQVWDEIEFSGENLCLDIEVAPENDTSIETGVDNENLPTANLLPLYKVKDDLLLSNSQFNYSETANETNKIKPDPYLQLSELEFTDKSAYGFLKMALKKPNEGFGFEMYAQVVSAVALVNAERLINSIKEDANGQNDDPPIELLNSPNPPFVPKAESFTANYKASVTYKFEYDPKSYPLQWFYISPFENYAAYDNSIGGVNKTNPEASNMGSVEEDLTLPLYPEFCFEGALFLEIENLVAPNEINLNFQLAPNFVSSKIDPRVANSIYYDYLTSSGWEKMPILSDGTHSFSCPGIISLNVLSDISKEHLQMPGDNYWISIGVKNDPSDYAQTTFLKSNGLELQRTGLNFLDDLQNPRISSDAIVGPVEDIPQIASVIQPFPSFGGRAAEDDNMMYQRVSTRLKSKDRVISSTDYFRMVKERFLDIFYVKTFFDNNRIEILLVKKVDNWSDANALKPLVTKCEELEVESYLRQRSSAFAKFKISNFQLEKITVNARITVKIGYEFDGVSSGLNAALNIFLAPWIESKSQQIKIDSDISIAEVEGFIANYPGVARVTSVYLTPDSNNKKSNPPKTNTQIYHPKNKSTLFVPAAEHNINPIL